jgi:hypothetical protein
MEQRNLKIRNDMFQQKNKRAKLGEGGREREESSMLVRTFLCLSFCSLVTDALSLLETILECCCSCLPKPKKLHRHNLLASQSRYSAGRQREEKRMKLRWDYSPRTCACDRIQSGSCRCKEQPAPFTFFLSCPFLLFSDKYLCCRTAR